MRKHIFSMEAIFSEKNVIVYSYKQVMQIVFCNLEDYT